MLLDHFSLPLRQTHPWKNFHTTWATMIVQQLNGGILPSGYYALPEVNRGNFVQVDIGTLSSHDCTDPDPTCSGAVWTPTAPRLRLAVEIAPLNSASVHVMTDDGDPSLLAAIELVSPRNKDRPDARQAFVGKCAGYLQQGCSVVIVDLVTERRANLNQQLLALFRPDIEWPLPPGLSAVAYRVINTSADQPELQIGPLPLAIGAVLPTVPLWLEVDLAVPLDLQSSYQATCKTLLLPHTAPTPT